MKVKFFRNSYGALLEEAVNEFIGRDDILVHDVKFQTAQAERSTHSELCVMVQYEPKSKARADYADERSV